jgi:hypothetical protein
MENVGVVRGEGRLDAGPEARCAEFRAGNEGAASSSSESESVSEIRGTPVVLVTGCRALGVVSGEGSGSVVAQDFCEFAGLGSECTARLLLLSTLEMKGHIRREAESVLRVCGGVVVVVVSVVV